MSRLLISLTAILFLFANLPFSADAGFIYSNDFQGAMGGEWSKVSFSTTPVGNRRFLGIFGNETVQLTLDGVQNHQLITLSFDLLVIQTWDGSQLVDPLSSPLHTVGPDIWSVGVEGEPELLSTTFSVIDGTKAMHSFRDFPQAFPGLYPTDSFKARTGAAENDTLGYFEGDSVYSLSFNFEHVSGPLVLNFSGNFPQGDPEEWGLDNVAVTGETIIPEPSILTLLATGSLCLVGGWCRRRKRAAAIG